MLSRMITRLLFKAVLSIGMLLGVASYGHYLSGGDPGALWKRVAGGAVGDVARSFDGLRDTAGAPVAALSGGEGRGARESVWRWRDADGIMHYATAQPAGVEATLVRVDPNVNVLAPVRAPATVITATTSSSGVATGETPAAGFAAASSGTRAGTARTNTSGSSRGGQGGEPMPGIAGAILNARGDAPAPDPERAAALLRMLQAPSR